MSIIFDSKIDISRVRYWSYRHLFNTGYGNWSSKTVRDGFDRTLTYIKRKNENNT